jgi:short-subunit dehydrogenase
MTKQLAMVTGASSGIGYSLANELAGRGYDLIICSAGERLESAVAQLQTNGGEVTAVQADLATREGVDALWSEIKAKGRPVEVACINAGVGVGGLFSETDLDAEMNMVYLNCASTVQLAKYVIKDMLARNSGKILFTASIAGEWWHPEKPSMLHRRHLYSRSLTASGMSCEIRV